MATINARIVDSLRRAAAHPRVLPATALVLRALTVRGTVAFLLRELLHSSKTSVYVLRENGLRIAIRHGTGDVVTLGEVFHDRTYQPMDQVASNLRETQNILDLGANIGMFGAFAATRWSGAHIVAYEPDPDNATVHERFIAENRLENRLTLVRAAAGPRTGVTAFAAGEIALSRLVEADDAPHTVIVPIKDVLQQIAEADLVKMDIEGGEWAIVEDQRFRESPPRVLALEYHPHLCPHSDPHTAIDAALKAAGMRMQWISRQPDGYGMLWAWRR